VALSIVLLIGAGLIVESFAHLRRVELGFDPSSLLTMRVALPPSRYETDRKKAGFYAELLRRLEAVPGVRGATVAPSAPTTEGVLFPIQIEGRPVESEGHRLRGQWQSITPGYFRVLGIPLRRGREFSAHDTLDAPWVVIINEAMARRFWPQYPRGEDPVGQYMLFARSSISAQIVGIAADVHESALAADMGPEAYMPVAQRCLQTMTLMVRTTGDPRRFVNAVRAEVLEVDRDQPVSDVRMTEEVIDGSISRERLTLILLGAFSGLALLLAVIGIYGVISYSVAQRTHELAIRRALGAQAEDIFTLVIRQAVELTVAGLAIGIPAAMGLTRLLSGLLFRVSATDPAIFGAVAVVFVVIAFMASTLPARRAVRVDALR
jgi:predicted permease